MRILNLTQHDATPEQIEAGVIEPSDKDKQRIKELLTFNEIEDSIRMIARAEDLRTIAARYMEGQALYVMIGGAPFFMSTLQTVITKMPRMYACYAFSTRDSIEKDGKKISVFKHKGFYYV